MSLGTLGSILLDSGFSTFRVNPYDEIDLDLCYRVSN